MNKRYLLSSFGILLVTQVGATDQLLENTSDYSRELFKKVAIAGIGLAVLKYGYNVLTRPKQKKVTAKTGMTPQQLYKRLGEEALDHRLATNKTIEKQQQLETKSKAKRTQSSKVGNQDNASVKKERQRPHTSPRKLFNESPQKKRSRTYPTRCMTFSKKDAEEFYALAYQVLEEASRAPQSDSISKFEEFLFHLEKAAKFGHSQAKQEYPELAYQFALQEKKLNKLEEALKHFRMAEEYGHSDAKIEGDKTADLLIDQWPDSLPMNS